MVLLSDISIYHSQFNCNMYRNPIFNFRSIYSKNLTRTKLQFKIIHYNSIYNSIRNYINYNSKLSCMSRQTKNTYSKLLLPII